jgi:hypothetical protein
MLHKGAATEIEKQEFAPVIGGNWSYFCLYAIYAFLAASSSSCSSAIPLPAHSIHFYSELAF